MKFRQCLSFLLSLQQTLILVAAHPSLLPTPANSPSTPASPNDLLTTATPTWTTSSTSIYQYAHRNKTRRRTLRSV
ncbi:hypothetical protein BDZ45DRAFT_675865 [Acephala macrosclerotiorum]|nr:hypothetical protein BDZ45DRAFT_675865 [Acephala macrosclerotiorum]